MYQELTQQLTPDQPGHLTAKNPFRGLLSFEEEHSSLYFGREAEVDAFVENLRYEPVLPVVGPSGAGKSSFVKAGVIPRLREKAPVILVQVRPGQDPFLSLASNLISAWRRPTHSTGSLGLMGSILGLQKANAEALESFGNAKDLAQDLFNRPHQLGLLLHQLAEQNRAYVVLFVDQLEELCAVEQIEEKFPESSEGTGTGIEPSGGVLGRFMQAIAGAADDPQIPVRVIVTMREEFLTRLMTSGKVRKALNQITVLRKPSQKTLVDILERTVKAFGYKFEEFHLPYELVDDVKASQACFPLLQFACQVMWQNRDEPRKVLTRKAYKEMGGVTGALVQHAEGVLAGLTAQEANLAKKMLLRLVTEDKARRIMNQEDLLLGLQDNAQGVLERLVESRLVTISRKTPQGCGCAEEGEEGECELVHEALVSNWKRLNNWIDESREELGLLRQLEQASQLWEKRGRRADDLWSKQALKEAHVVLEQAISQNLAIAEFVQASERQNRKGRLRRTAVFGIMVTIVFGAAWSGNHLLRSELCTGAQQEIATVWNQQVKENINKSFLGTGVSYAKDTVVRVHKLFDDYTEKWSKHYTKACEATHVKGEQSDEVLDLRMGCLRKRIGEIEALLKVFAAADPGVVQKAVLASTSLTFVSSCANVEALRASYPPPKTVEEKAKVAAIREKLAEVEAMSKTGKYREGLKLAEVLDEEAKWVGYRPVQAEVLYKVGKLLEIAGEYKRAEAILHDAAREAGESRDGLLVVEAMTLLVWIVGGRQARHDEGLSIARYAENMLGVVRGDDTLRSLLLYNRGEILYSKGDYDRALRYYRKALEIREKSFGSEHTGVASTLNNIGNVFFRLREYEKALEYYRKSQVIKEKVLGSEHPLVALSLNNIGMVFAEQGEYERALESYYETLAIWEKALGFEHPHVAGLMHNLGWVFWKRSDYDKALDYFRKSLAVDEKLLGAEHPNVAESLRDIGILLIDKRMPQQALEPLERSWRICRKIKCQPAVDGLVRYQLARALVAAVRDEERGIKLANQAREIFEKTPKAFKKELDEVNTWLQKHGAEKLAKKAQQ